MNRQVPQSPSVGEELLYIEQCRATELVHPCASPVRPMWHSPIVENIQRQQRAYKNFWPYGEVSLFSARETKNSIALWPTLSEKGIGLHIQYASELRWVFKQCLPTENLVINARDLSNHLIQKCIHLNITMTVEHTHQAERINTLAKTLNKKASIRLQVKLELIRPEMSPSLGERLRSFSGKKNPSHTHNFLQTGKQILALAHIKLNGLHVYCNEAQKTRNIARHMIVLGIFISKLSKAWGGFQPKELILQGIFFKFRPAASTAFFCDYKIFNIELFAQLLLSKFRNSLIKEELKLAGMTLRIIYNDAHANSILYLDQRQQEKSL